MQKEDVVSLFKKNKVLYRCLLALMVGYVVLTLVSWGSLPAYMRKPEFTSYLKHIGFIIFGIYMISKGSHLSNYAGFALFNFHSWQAFFFIHKELSHGSMPYLEFWMDVEGIRFACLFGGTLLLWPPIVKRLMEREFTRGPEQDA